MTLRLPARVHALTLPTPYPARHHLVGGPVLLHTRGDVATLLLRPLRELRTWSNEVQRKRHLVTEVEVSKSCNLIGPGQLQSHPVLQRELCNVFPAPV